MYHFVIKHKSGKQTEYHNIGRVEYSIASMEQVVEGDEIKKHKFPTCSDLYLFSDDCTNIVASADISSMIVSEE